MATYPSAEWKTHKNVSYFADYRRARMVRDRLQQHYPEVRIVSYQRGYAIQQHRSGPYWNHDAASFK